MLAATFLSSYHGGMMSHINEALAVGELRETSKRSQAFSGVPGLKRKLRRHNMWSSSLCLNKLLSIANDTSSEQSMPFFSFHFIQYRKITHRVFTQDQGFTPVWSSLSLAVEWALTHSYGKGSFCSTSTKYSTALALLKSFELTRPTHLQGRTLVLVHDSYLL